MDVKINAEKIERKKEEIVFAGIMSKYKSIEIFLMDLNLQFGGIQDSSSILIELRGHTTPEAEKNTLVIHY